MDNGEVIRISKSAVIVLTVLSIIGFIVGNHFGVACESHVFGCLSVLIAPNAVIDTLHHRLTHAPLALDLQGIVLGYGAIGALLPWAIYLVARFSSKREYMYNAEHGTSRWATQAESEAFADLTDERNNIILSDTDRMALEPKKFNVQTDRNKNILLLGGPGSGKTRYNMKPNLMQLNSSYVVTDPKGTLVPEVGKLFCGEGGKIPEECMYIPKKDLYEYKKLPDGTMERTVIASKGEPVPYRFRVLNLVDFSKSMRYNPFAYMRSGRDILKLVNVLIKNTEGEGAQKGDDFWVKAEALLYQALFAYIYYECAAEDQWIGSVLDLINAAGAKEDDENYMSPLDIIFYELETGKHIDKATGAEVQVKDPQPDHYAVRQYKKFKMAAGKTLKSILISCAARLAIFEQEDVRDLMRSDELGLDTIGDYPTALFLVIPDTDKQTFKAISAMCTYQLFDLLCAHADNDCGGKLPVPVQCLFDEFANIGCISDFDCLITTIRSRGISAEIVLQNAGQLDRDYDKAARIIKGGCDTTIYLGKSDHETCKEISERMGKRTIAAASLTKNDGQNRSTSLSDQLIQRDLEDPAEVERMNATECRVLISGAMPIKAKKYRLERHPLYRYIDPGHDGAAYTTAFDAQAHIADTRRSAMKASSEQTRARRKKRQEETYVGREMSKGEKVVVIETDAAKKLQSNLSHVTA